MIVILNLIRQNICHIKSYQELDGITLLRHIGWSGKSITPASYFSEIPGLFIATHHKTKQVVAVARWLVSSNKYTIASHNSNGNAFDVSLSLSLALLLTRSSWKQLGSYCSVIKSKLINKFNIIKTSVHARFEWYSLDDEQLELESRKLQLCVSTLWKRTLFH